MSTLTEPVNPVESLFYPTLKTRMFPFVGTFCVSMFDRIVVYIVHVSGKILLIENQMFPEPPLPDASLTSFVSRS